VQREVEEESGLPLAASSAEQGERVAGDERAAIAVEDQRFGLRPFKRDKLGERQRERPLVLGVGCAGSLDELHELVAAARPVAPVVVDGRPDADGAAADDPCSLGRAFVACLVGVVAEVYGCAARDHVGPLALEGLGASRADEDRCDVPYQAVQARTVAFAFRDEPVGRIETARDDRPQPGRRRLGARVVRAAVERPVLDRGDAPGGVAAREGEQDAATVEVLQPGAERLERVDLDPLRLAERFDLDADLPVDAADRLERIP
jgi:hypothetical protein